MGIIRTALTSRAVRSLTSPNSIDDYLEQVHPMLAADHVRARVVEVRRETGEASTVVMRPNGAWRGFRPGQHVQFGVEVDGTRRIRVFSVSSAPTSRRSDRTFSVSVKAHPDGYVSQFLHRELAPGTIVYLSQAEGEFVLPEVVPSTLLLVSGGSGVTPVMSMLRTLRDEGHAGDVTFLHYARSRDDEMFTDELDEIAATTSMRVVRVYTRAPEPGAELAGRFHVDHLKHLGLDPATTLTYVCGPAGLIASVRDTYDELGAADQLRQEYFKVPSVDVDAADATGTLAFDDSLVEAPNTGQTILEQAEAAGLQPDFGCRMGVCNTCALKKNSGAVRHVVTGEISADTDQTIKICVQVPVGDVNVAL
ncbi:2Fe-2S iron-sulfur cluster binding domain-containing protein [Aeromicrobium sp. CFBP 8757]|uniref:ferredoxin reductase n=1 Tax=Aeromicrobium sp. CFBP 8757 TaxID=2775288 RepID=UPI00177E5D8F|nr:2Fe-2S iron-sulfur cluster-binding protein [Aeromicrobium sp. CFBP 8757]MBD8608111.1 2Fe-2S iron-sulfur cluster binding domain-containing protein [Aeromicrobium sp. CFBP 8757]